MSGSTQGASPEGWAGAANETGGGASSRKLTIGYLLCNEEDHHPPRAARLALAGSRRSAAADGAPQPRGAVEQPPRGAPPRTRAADHRPAGTREPGVGRSRTDGGQAGHGSGGERDECERHPPPPPPRHARPAVHGESAARLSIPPLRLPPGGRQGRGAAPTGGAIEWPPVSARQIGSFGDGGPPQRSPRTQWSGPLVSRDDGLVSLPVHLANPPVEDPWRGHQEKSSQHPAPAPSDQQQPPQEGPLVPSEGAKERCSQGPSYSAPLSEAPDAAGHRKRPLPALWHPPLPPQEDPPLSNSARPAGSGTPRQRPYVPAEGRVARVAPWPRSAGGVGGAGLLYPPLRALRPAVRGLPSAFHGGLPPLLPPSSASLSLVDLQRPPPATPLSRRVDVASTAKAPAEGGAEGAPEAASDRDPLRQPGQPGGDSKGQVAGGERAHQSPQGVSLSSVKAEAPSGAGSHIFPTDKPALDPVRFVLGPSIVYYMLVVHLLSCEVTSATRCSGSCAGCRLQEAWPARCRWTPPRENNHARPLPATTARPLTWTVLDPSCHRVHFFVAFLLMCALASSRSRPHRTRAKSAASASLIVASCSPTSATYTRGPGDRLSASAAVLAFDSAPISRSTWPPCTSRRSRTHARFACTALAVAVICTYTVALACSLRSCFLPAHADLTYVACPCPFCRCAR